MEPSPQAVQKPQRSPWLYVLLGCGGFALLSCLGVGAFFAFVYKKGADMVAGVTDPKQREDNARKMLGSIPEGYYPAASLSFFGMVDMALLVDSPPLSDGGFDLTRDEGREFIYYRVMASEQNKASKAFFTSDTTDTSALARQNIRIDASAIAKRGSFTLETRKFYYVASRGSVAFGNGQQAQRQGLNTAVLFDCPGEQLHVGVWTQRDPDPSKSVQELDLTGTVADEAELKKFLSPIDPCGR